MIPILLALGQFEEEAVAEFGPIVAATEATVELPAVPTAAQVDSTLPLGAMEFQRPLDPSDLAPYAVGFANIAGAAEITAIERVTMSAAGVAVGVTIEAVSPRRPIIDEVTKKKVQLWLSVTGGTQANAAFNGSGLKVGIALWVRLSDGRLYERTVVVVGRQL